MSLIEGATPKGIQKEKGILPIQPFLTPASRVRQIDIDPETLELVRELYAAELTFVDSWIGKLLNKLDDLGLADNTVVYYLSDHGLTLGEHGIIGKSTPRPVPRDPPRAVHHPRPERRLAGETSSYFASTHDVARDDPRRPWACARPGLMNGEDLTRAVRRQASRRRRAVLHRLLPGDLDLRRPRLADDLHTRRRQKRAVRPRVDPGETTRRRAPATRRRSTSCGRCSSSEAGGTLPQFDDHIGVVGGDERRG